MKTERKSREMVHHSSILRGIAWVACAGILAAGLAMLPMAAQARTAPQGPFGGVAPVGKGELGELRGGFDVGNDAIIRFGFDFSGSVNGNTFEFPQTTLAVSATGQAQMFNANGDPIVGTGVQNIINNAGAGLTAADLANLESQVTRNFAGVLNIVQNSVDLARIQTVNTITIEFLKNSLSTSLAGLRQNNLNAAMAVQSLMSLR